MRIFQFLVGVIFTTVTAHSQQWQQKVDYRMDIDMDVQTYRYSGEQTVTYTNNSNDTLRKIYYHLYFNAFQPGSEMDIRLQNIADPDSRMVNNIGTSENPINESRIAKLKPSEIGLIRVLSLKQNGKAIYHRTEGTVLEVDLDAPILPKKSTVLKMNFQGQVPLQIRRSGRNSKEGVALSMVQWYPKVAAYDDEGWHPNPYIAREFYSDWGNFDVKIKIDKKYTVAGTGILQNPKKIGHGYTAQKIKTKGKKLTWHFKGEKLHDFAWAADPDYQHDILKTKKGVDLHFFYKKNLDKKYLQNWKTVQKETAFFLDYYEKNIGAYPYQKYSVIQGGDGGMEYAMCTLITGKRKLGSLRGVIAHEFAHTWFQFLLATNESKHPWMDEGFTTYISNKAMDALSGTNKTEKQIQAGSYRGYEYLVKSGAEKPQTTHADRYHTNTAYSIASYSKGAIFLSQLGYIIGQENLSKTLKKYYKDFVFKHPKPNDIKRCAEKVSGLNLEWYLNEWTQTTNHIDYSIEISDAQEITLKRIGATPMPLDILVTYEDGSTEEFYIPLDLMRGEKPHNATLLKDSNWGNPLYIFNTPKNIKKAVIDPSKLMADINLKNNTAEK